jgi:hypothetical protein
VDTSIGFLAVITALVAFLSIGSNGTRKTAEEA